MAKDTRSKSDFLSANLAPDELQQILQRIDENLALRPLWRQREDELHTATAQGAPPPLPDLGELFWHAQELHNMQAPLFVIKGRDLQNQLKRLLNWPIRVFGHKQIRFNRELLELVGLILTQLDALRRQAEYVDELRQVIEQLREQVKDQQAVIQTLVDQPQTRRVDVVEEATFKPDPPTGPRV